MSVTFITKISGYTSSNKYTVTKDHYPFAYSYNLHEIGKVLVLEPLIDKVSITVPVLDPKIRAKVHGNLNKAEKWRFGKDFKKAFGPRIRSRYRFAINVKLLGGEKLLVQGVPWSKGAGHLLRLEFNPAKLTQGDLSVVKERFREVTSELLQWDHVVEFGRATRVDVAVDLVNARMTDLLVVSNVHGKNHFYVGEGGDLETAYVGIPTQKKPAEQLVYDKLKQSVDKGQKPGYSGIYHSRVEIISKSKNLKLANIAKIKNPLTRVTIVHPGSPPPGVDPVIWGLFLETCRYRGVTGALKLVPDDVAEACKTALDEAAGESWRPDKIWKHWPKVVKNSGLLDPA